MTHPLDRDGDGRKGGSLPKRGRPKKVVEAIAPNVESVGRLTVKVADAIHDGEGGFYPVGHKFDAADEAAAEALKAKGLAE